MKRALILGVNGSLGNEFRLSLEENGFDVLGTTKRGKNDSVKNSFEMDFANREDIDKLISNIKLQGNLDVVTSTIANKIIFNKFELMNIEEFEDDLTVNVLNYVYFLKKVLPLMNKGGSIVFILSSVVDNKPPSYCSSYVSSKYYLLGLMKVLSEELKSKNIRVNALSPGVMDTNFIKKLPDAVKKMYVQNTTNKEYIDPKTVAEEFVKIVLDDTVNGDNIIIT